MAIDTPARLAVLGAGPIGLEAALYGRFLGYDVLIYEQGNVAQSLRAAPALQMSTPFRLNHSTLALAAIQAQDDAYQTPNPDVQLTYGEWIDRYLAPLAATDLLFDHLRLRTTVIALEREDTSPLEIAEEDEAAAPSFRVRSRTSQGEEQSENFAGILDCTGAQNPVTWLGICPPPAAPANGLNQSFHTSQPDYYILGSKSRGPGHEFLFQDGLNQIREVFALLGDRARLDLYASAARLLR